MMKNEFSASISSQIPLREVSNVQRLEAKGFCFEIVRDMGNSNSSKSYFISMKSDSELYAWMVSISYFCVPVVPQTDRFRMKSTIDVR